MVAEMLKIEKNIHGYQSLQNLTQTAYNKTK